MKLSRGRSGQQDITATAFRVLMDRDTERERGDELTKHTSV